MLDERRQSSSDLVRFALLFFVLYTGFGVTSPFFPAFLSYRGVSPEQIGIVLSVATFIRLFAGPLASNVADRLQARRNVFAVCTFGSAILAGAFGISRGFEVLIAITLLHAAFLAPTTILADALALRIAAPEGGRTRFEYGWVRGVGSAAFIAGSLLSGQAVEILGPVAALSAQALLLACAAGMTFLVPESRVQGRAKKSWADTPARAIPTLLSRRPFRYLVFVASIVLGSHAMHDAFAMIAWNAAGISPITGSILWSLSVGAEVIIFLIVGPRLLRTVSPPAAMVVAALAAALRWIVLGLTSSVLALALVEPLHGFTFALLHLACMRIIVLVTPSAWAATAQAIYACGIATTSALLTLASGFLYSELGSVGFLMMAILALGALPVIWALSRSLRGQDIQGISITSKG